jgi:hypothetical protein
MPNAAQSAVRDLSSLVPPSWCCSAAVGAASKMSGNPGRAVASGHTEDAPVPAESGPGASSASVSGPNPRVRTPLSATATCIGHFGRPAQFGFVADDRR